MVLLFKTGYVLGEPWFFKGLTPKTPDKEPACEFSNEGVMPVSSRNCNSFRHSTPYPHPLPLRILTQVRIHKAPMDVASVRTENAGIYKNMLT